MFAAPTNDFDEKGWLCEVFNHIVKWHIWTMHTVFITSIAIGWRIYLNTTAVWFPCCPLVRSMTCTFKNVSSVYVFYLKSSQNVKMFSLQIGKAVMVGDNRRTWGLNERSESFYSKRAIFFDANRVIHVGAHVWTFMYVNVIEECRSKWFTLQNSTIIHLMRLIPGKCKLSKKKMETLWYAEMLYIYVWCDMCEMIEYGTGGKFKRILYLSESEWHVSKQFSRTTFINSSLF